MRGRISLFVVWTICAVIITLRSSVPAQNVITWDVFGYYLYLPATIIHDDPGLQQPWLTEVMATYEPSATLYQLTEAPNGGRAIRYSAGMAEAYAPFFLVAHALATPMGYAADGFSPPYQVAITIGCLLYALLGLFLLRRALLHFFDDRWTALLVAAIALGTNYFQLVAFDGTLLTHPLLFTLYAGLLLVTIHWHKAPSMTAALLLGALTGTITLVRPSEIVCVLIPLLWGLGNRAGTRAKWTSIKLHPLHVVVATLAFAAAVLPQSIYWKITTDQWIFYSYVNPGEGFDLDAPHLRDYLFSFRKGWLLYTPLMVLAILGIPLLWERLPEAAWAVAIFLLIDLWVVSSWSCWWYAGGSFSARSMVPAYVVLAIPLGLLLRSLWTQATLRLPLTLVIGAFVVLNLFQTWQWMAGIINKERMTMAYYSAIFGRTHIPPNAEDLLLVQRSLGNDEHLTDTSRYTSREVLNERFNDRPDSVFILDEVHVFSPGLELPYDQLTTKDHVWVRASVKLWVGDSVQPPPTVVITFQHEGGTYKYATSSWAFPLGTRNMWVDATMDYLTPEVRSPKDPLKVYVWNQHGGTHRIDDLRIQVFERN